MKEASYTKQHILPYDSIYMKYPVYKHRKQISGGWGAECDCLMYTRFIFGKSSGTKSDGCKTLWINNATKLYTLKWLQQNLKVLLLSACNIHIRIACIWILDPTSHSLIFVKHSTFLKPMTYRAFHICSSNLSGTTQHVIIFCLYD